MRWFTHPAFLSYQHAEMDCWECRKCGGHYGMLWAALHWHSGQRRWPRGRHAY